MFSTDTLTRFQALETPFYFYDLGLLSQTLQACKTAADKYGFHVHYAMKANFDPKVLETIQSFGFGADCVSGNEVKAAIATGFRKEQVVFAGVGKSDKEINLALDADIFSFNAETLRSCSNIHFIGIHFHIGSQITDLTVYKSLCIRINEMQTWFEDHGFPVMVLNAGGGLGVDYHHPDQDPIPDFEGYFKVFKDFLNVKPGQEVHFELGRALVAQSASLISRVLYVKYGQKKNFLVLDAGMTELIRPMLYQAYMKIENISREAQDAVVATHEQRLKYDVVGPICESTDCFQKDVMLPESFRGDLIAVRTAGAYGQVMASRYNLRDAVGSVYSQ